MKQVVVAIGGGLLLCFVTLLVGYLIIRGRTKEPNFDAKEGSNDKKIRKQHRKSRKESSKPTLDNSLYSNSIGSGNGNINNLPTAIEMGEADAEPPALPNTNNYIQTNATSPTATSINSAYSSGVSPFFTPPVGAHASTIAANIAHGLNPLNNNNNRPSNIPLNLLNNNSTVNNVNGARAPPTPGGDVETNADLLATVIALNEVDNQRVTPGGDVQQTPRQQQQLPMQIQTQLQGQRKGANTGYNSQSGVSNANSGNRAVISAVTPMGDENDGGNNANGGLSINNDDESDSSDSMEAMAQIRSQMIGVSGQAVVNVGYNVNNTYQNNNNSKMFGNRGNDDVLVQDDADDDDDEKLDVLEDDPDFNVTPMGH